MGTGEMEGLKVSNLEGLKKAKKEQGIQYPLPKRLYTLPEAAAYLGRTLWSMRELVWAGKIPIVRDGKRIFVDIRDLESYIAKNKMTYV
jgi:excisionase family DNA binding protein